MWAALAAPVFAIPAAMPAPTAAPSPKEVEVALQKRATCTFSGTAGYKSAIASKASCAVIVLDALTVPGGVTLDLTGLADDTVVYFEGETVFDYVSSPIPTVERNDPNEKTNAYVSVGGMDGATLRSQRYWYQSCWKQRLFPQWQWRQLLGWWWRKQWQDVRLSFSPWLIGMVADHIYSKPKFFQAHNIVNGLLEQLTITNPPVQVFSIDDCTNTEFAYITIDGSAGDSLGKNTDGFDIGSSTGITIGMMTSALLCVVD